MAVPKRKHSNARTGKRRAHDAKTPPHIAYCEHCSAAITPHTVCPKCGYYMDRKVMEVEG